MKYLTCTLLAMVMSACHAKNEFNIYTNGHKNECKYDDGEIDFCSKIYESFYKNSLKYPKNSDQDKILRLKEDDGVVVVVDIKNKDIYTLNGQFSDVLNNSGKVIKPLKLNFSKNDNKLCITGAKYSYQNSDPNGNFCYKLNNNRFEEIEAPSKKEKVVFMKLPANTNWYSECTQKKSEKYCDQKIKEIYHSYSLNEAKKIAPILSILGESYKKIDFVQGNTGKYVIAESITDDEDFSFNYTLIDLESSLTQIYLGDWFEISENKVLKYKDENGKLKNIQLD